MCDSTAGPCNMQQVGARERALQHVITCTVYSVSIPCETRYVRYRSTFKIYVAIANFSFSNTPCKGMALTVTLRFRSEIALKVPYKMVLM